MEKLTININVRQYKNKTELNEEDRKILEVALSTVKKAYAPYSNFFVAAAVLLENGEIITGTNQENIAYPSGLCAERVAIFYANSKYPDVAIKTIAICAYNNGEYTKIPTTPCGSCRQVMIESEMRFKKPIKVIMYGKDKILSVDDVKSLLPIAFSF